MNSKISNWLSAVADLFQVASFFGLTPAAIFASVVLVAGIFGQVSIFWVIVFVPISFVAILYLTRLIAPNIGLISLNEGARQAYETLRGTLWAKAAEQLRVGSTPEAITEYLATGIVSEDIPIFGKYLPSQKLEKIKPNELKSGSIIQGGNTLELRDSHKSKIVDLTIRKSDLKKAIKRMKESDKAMNT